MFYLIFIRAVFAHCGTIWENYSICLGLNYDDLLTVTKVLLMEIELAQQNLYFSCAKKSRLDYPKPNIEFYV